LVWQATSLLVPGVVCFFGASQKRERADDAIETMIAGKPKKIRANPSDPRHPRSLSENSDLTR
jgi:hypothetical protein